MSEKEGPVPSHWPLSSVSQLPELSRREFIYVTGALAVALVVPGCGGGGSTDGSTPATSDFFKASNVVVKGNVVVLPSDGSVTIADVATDTVTLMGSVPALAIGSVLVSGLGAGLIRIVKSVTPNGSDTIVGTADADLVDVFESASIEFRQSLSPEHVKEIQILLDGAVIDGVQNVTQSRGRAVQAFQIKIPKTFIGGTDGQGSGGIDFTADGALAVAITGDIKITLENGLEKMEILQATSWVGKYAFDLKGQVTFGRTEIPYATFIFDPIPLGSAGPVPILLLPVLALQIAAAGTVAAGWEVTGSESATQVMGMNYVPKPLGSDFKLEDVTFIHSQTQSGKFVGPNFFETLRLEGVPLQADLRMSIDGLVGPNIKVDLPAFDIDLKEVPSTNSTTVDVNAVFRGRVGANAGLLGKAIPQFSVIVKEEKLPIFSHTFKPGDGDVEVH